MKSKFLWFTLFILVSISMMNSIFEEVNAAVKPTAKIAKIDAILDTTMIRKEFGLQYVLDEYKKLTGIDLRINQPPHNQYFEKLLIAFASNEIPDIVELDSDHYLQFASEGAIIPIDNLIAKSMAMKRIDNSYINALKLRDGKIYGFPLNQGGGTVTYIRKDWLNNLGLKIPQTYDELNQVMRAFTFRDPDKNGKDDTFGYTLPGVVDEIYMRDFYQDATHAFTVQNGKWIDGFSQPNFKKALERLKTAYQDKVLDKETFTNQTSTSREKFFAGKAGIINYWSGPWAKVLDENVKASCGPKAEVVAIPAIKGTFYYNRISPILAITKAAKNPEAVFNNFIDFMYDGGKGQMLFTHGVEGIHWKKQGKEYIKLPSLANKSQIFGKVYIQPDLALATWKDPFPLDPLIAASRQVNIQNQKQLKLLPLSETYLKNGGDLANLKQEVIAKIMLGTYSIDEGLKIYKERSAMLGVDKMLNEFNK